MKRVAIIITDNHSIAWAAADEPLRHVLPTSWTLLEDLRGVCGLADAGLIVAKKAKLTPPGGSWLPVERMLARVRAAIGDTGV